MSAHHGGFRSSESCRDNRPTVSKNENHTESYEEAVREQDTNGLGPSHLRNEHGGILPSLCIPRISWNRSCTYAKKTTTFQIRRPESSRGPDDDLSSATLSSNYVLEMPCSQFFSPATPRAISSKIQLLKKRQCCLRQHGITPEKDCCRKDLTMLTMILLYQRRIE
ncbi:unnamed protein product [Amoebophrya sp. A120]|nr:unnamed protein product [Amoebophrya sp. A120]|eukprot:GSA120T00025361001.1